MTADATLADEVRRLLAAFALLGASTAGTVIAALTAIAVAGGAPHFALLGALGVVAAAGAGVLAGARRPRLRRAAGLALGLAVVLALPLVAPRGWRAEAPALTRAVTLEGEPVGAPWFGGIPERELVRLGGFVGTRGAEWRWFEAGLFDDLYDHVARDGVVDPATSYTLDAWVLDRRHLWLAAPEGRAPAPLVVFLHGSGGPMHFYPQALARAALARGAVLALPTWGFGCWETPEGRRRVADTVEAVARLRPIDRRRVYLAGLSNGGLGAVDVFARDPGPFAACAAISGAPAELPPGLPAPPFGGRPLLLVHGAHDPRIPVEWPRNLAMEVRGRGGAVEYDEVDGDHFILLTHEAEVVPRVLDWLLARPPAVR